MKDLFIPILLGTNRKDRQSENVAKWVFGQMKEREEIETQFFDVRDFDLPQDDYGTKLGKDFPEWRDAIIKADGFVIVTPEYNHGYPGIMKSVLDLLLKNIFTKRSRLSAFRRRFGAALVSSKRVFRWFVNSVLP